MSLGDVLMREVKIQAQADVVFDYFVDPDKAARWKGMRAELDPTPGGLYRVEVIPGSTSVGEYVEIDRPRRVVYTWGWEGHEAIPPGSTTVEVTFEQDGEYTLVRLVHRGLPAEARAQHDEGWTHYLDRLVVAAAGGDPGPDPWAEAAG